MTTEACTRERPTELTSSNLLQRRLQKQIPKSEKVLETLLRKLDMAKESAHGAASETSFETTLPWQDRLCNLLIRSRHAAKVASARTAAAEAAEVAVSEAARECSEQLKRMLRMREPHIIDEKGQEEPLPLRVETDKLRLRPRSPSPTRIQHIKYPSDRLVAICQFQERRWHRCPCTQGVYNNNAWHPYTGEAEIVCHPRCAGTHRAAEYLGENKDNKKRDLADLLIDQRRVQNKYPENGILNSTASIFSGNPYTV
jgi:hypothetical protein